MKKVLGQVNEGFTIFAHEKSNTNAEYVFGVSITRGEYVTWSYEPDRNKFLLGHYFRDFKSADDDFWARTQEQ